jgi:2-keto-4-pentenoate hydratase/2-oxohepta-3-ene-1,7-dioic acid hydratase in catechol pathway
MRLPAWSLVQYTVPADAAARLGLLVADTVRRAPADLADATMLDLLDHWTHAARLLRSLDGQAVERLEVVPDATLVAPLTYPRKVLCAGANYYSHAKEMGTAQPSPSVRPYFFLKPPTTTVIGPYDPVIISSVPGAKVDWEAELGVVMADRCRDLTPEQVPEHVAGYLVANDISARGDFPRPDAVAPPFGWDWVAHKGQDGFCPIGPGLVPSWLVDDPQSLPLRLSVNNVVKQDSTTADMVVDIGGLVAEASRLVTLEPGDLILTGTPAGVGMPNGEFLRPGDDVAVEIEGIGTIINRIEAR